MVIIIKVVRIFCEINYEKNKESGELLQYTITILPALLLPYSRIPVDKILSSFSYYIYKKFRNQYEAAVEIFCENRHSFQLYYLRLKLKIERWYTFFIEGERDRLEEKNVENVQTLWERVAYFMKELAHPHYTPYWRAYAHTFLCMNGMGLGP